MVSQLTQSFERRAGFFELNEKMAEELPRFALLEGTIDDFIDDQENKNTTAKTDRDIILWKSFL